VALLSAEAEYLALGEAAKEAIFLMELLQELGYNGRDMNPMGMRIDSSAAISLATTQGSHPKTKHIRLRYHSIREMVKNKEVELVWVPSEAQAADPLTKPMPANKLAQTTMLLGLCTK